MKVASWIIPFLIFNPRASSCFCISVHICSSFPLSIILLRNDQTVVLSGTYSGNERNFLKEILSMHCLSSSASERPCHCCSTSILNMTMTSASGLPPEADLLLYIDSRIGRNGFQSINDSISASLSPTD
jgi:hypothetical protein